ncbi:polysaccharide deacetylase family protein [Halalkalibacter okhensis]|nr:polysaccharide deacetylase family protein [Halalkalibacter okhensis]
MVIRLLVSVCMMCFVIMVGCQYDASQGEIEQVSQYAEKWKEEEREKEQSLDKEEHYEKHSLETEEIENNAEKQYMINQTNWLVEPIGDASDQVVLLTIDDAPEQYSVKMAEILKELNVGAIFFVNGHFLQTEEDREKLRKIHELGFEIGNHTMTHPNLSQLSPEEQKNEIVELNLLIEEIINERPRFFRAPYGVNTDTSNQVVEDEGMQAMNWTYGYDWEKEYQEADSLAEIMVHSPLLTKGANLLMHDRKWTKEALAKIVLGLKEQGYDIVHPNMIKSR